MTETVVLVQEETGRRERPQSSDVVRIVRSRADVAEVSKDAIRQVWVVEGAHSLRLLKTLESTFLSKRSVVVLTADLPGSRLELLRTKFRSVLTPEPHIQMLPKDELLEAVRAPNRGELIVALSVDHEDQSVILYRGNLQSLAVPFNAFPRSGDGTNPDFSDAEVVDAGHALRFGAYEASTDSVLFEFSAEYRKAAKERRTAQNDTIGGSIRRARLMKRLRLTDFGPDLNERTLRRIEKNEVEPTNETLKKISLRLGMELDVLRSY